MIKQRFALRVVALLAIFLFARITSAESKSKVVLPAGDNKYSKLVKQLEAGQTNINYTEFRLSFLESAQFKKAGDLSDLRKSMHALMKESKTAEIVDVASKILSIDYTDMEAHKILRQAYKILGESANEKKHHDIEFGLLNSIVKKGDGKTCQTAWPVIQVTEEYFILQMMGASVLGQSLDNAGGFCDKMEVQTPDGKRTYYFEVTNVFKGYNERGIH